MSNPLKPEPARTPPRRWMRVLLVVSLSANLMILGVLGGLAMWQRADVDHRRPPRVDRAGGPLTHALSHEDRRRIGKKIWQEYRSTRAERPSRHAVRAQYKAVIDALRSDPFNSDVVRASLERQMSFATQRQQLGQTLLLERLNEMSMEERRSFADRLEDGLDRRRRSRD